ncbi:hypothetical protein V6N13_057755 [Hibiscus sabdariffa]
MRTGIQGISGFKKRTDKEKVRGKKESRSLRLKELSCRVRAAGQVLPIDGNKSTSPTLWWCPPPDWHKINTDTSRVLVDGRASGIGMVRDHLGRWRLGFHKFIDSAPRPNLTIHYRNRTKPWIRSGF